MTLTRSSESWNSSRSRCTDAMELTQATNLVMLGVSDVVLENPWALAFKMPCSMEVPIVPVFFIMSLKAYWIDTGSERTAADDGQC